jgi:tripartite-type tricarboxylate transporter receptor subunit TctC
MGSGTLSVKTQARALGLCIIAANMFGAGSAVAATAWPPQTIMMISDSSAGAPKDILLRQMAKALQTQNPGWRIIVDDKVGGDGAAAMSYLLSQPANGATMLIQSASFEVSMNTSLASLFKVSQFNLVAQTDSGDFVLAVNPKLNVHSLAELKEYAKAHKLSITGFGQNSMEHYAAALVAKSAGFEYSWVPYSSGTQAVTAVVGGNIDAVMVDASAANQFVKSGKLNGILVTAKNPVPIVPDVPTVASLGHPEDEIHLWHTILVKDGTPPEIVKTIESALKRLPENAEYAAYLKSASVEWDFMPGEEFAPKVKAEMAKIKDSLDMLKPNKK